MMNFAAIDFETATSARNSACSVAVVEVRDGQFYDSYYTLIVVAHNARFDMGVLRACLQTADLRAPSFAYADTVTISRRAWPDLPNHKLDTVGDFLHIDFHHHNALDDARTCAAIPLYAGRQMAVDDFRTLAEQLGFRIYPFGSRRAGIPR